MIFLSAILLSMGIAIEEKPELFEFPDPAADGISIQAVIPIPKVDPTVRSALEVCLRTACTRTQNFGFQDIGLITKTGDPVLTEIAGDHMRIGFSVDSDQLSTGLGLIESILTGPSFLKETLDRSAASVVISDKAGWNRAIFWDRAVSVRLTPDLAKVLWLRYVNRRTVKIGVGGNFAAGSAQSNWKARTAVWLSPPREAQFLRIPTINPPSGLKRGLVKLSMGPSLTANDPALPVAFLGSAILGVGKESLLWKVSREILGYSYRQEAFVTPTPTGWQPEMMIGTDESFSVEPLKKTLEAEIVKLEKSDLDRAISMIRANFLEGMPLGVVYWNRRGPGQFGLADEVFRQTFWRVKTGESWSVPSLVSRMNTLSVEETKAWLLQWTSTLTFKSTEF